MFPNSLFATEEGESEPAEYIFDDPAAEIEPNPILDLNVISNAGFASYRTDIADSLDVYTDKKIEFDILVDADAEDMSNAFLILSVYDVDANATIPEVDKVYLNDNYIGDLTGDNNAWSFTTFPLETEWIKGISNSQPGVNKIRIEVDSLRSTTFWVLCDWGAIKTNIGFQVISIIPTGTSIGSRQYEVLIKFNEELDEETIKGNVSLTYIDFNEIKSIDGKIKYDSEKSIVRFLPLSSLTYGVEYTVKVGKGIKNTKGVFLKNEKTATFVTLPTLKAK